MGFSLGDVLSDVSHYSEFVCLICHDLVDDPWTLQCSHIFCRHCVEEWFKTLASCPTCRSSDIGVAPLRETNPLAARILGRIRCICPLAKEGCTWQGDYSEVQSHLTNSQEHLGAQAQTPRREEDEKEAMEAQRRRNAEALKAQADGKYASRSYEEAAALYGKAIELAPDVATYYANRGACAYMLTKYEACVDDSDRALAADPSHWKAARRKARALVELSQFHRAGRSLSDFVAANPGADESLAPEVATVASLSKDAADGGGALFRGDFSTATKIFGRGLSKTTAVSFVLGAAVAEIGLGRIERALRLTMQAFKESSFKPTACAVRGVALVLQDLPEDQGLAFLKEALRLDPDYRAAQSAVLAVKRLRRDRAAAQQLHHVRDFENAVAAYDSVLLNLKKDTPDESDGGGLLPELALLAGASPLAANVHAERGTCHLRLGDYVATLRDTAAAIYIKDDCIEAHVTKAAALRGLGRFDDALNDLTALMERWGSNDSRIRSAYETAEFEARKAKRPDYYAVLGCRKISTEKEIKNAYYQRSREHHPDKHVNDPPELKQQHELAFKHCGEALDILSDPQKRRLYDDGHDKTAIEERIAAAERAAREHHRYGHHHHHHRHHH